MRSVPRVPGDGASRPRLLLLAAGQGTRMGDLTPSIPKAMLPVKRGRSILHITLANLSACSPAASACVIGGHGWPRLQAFCDDAALPVPVRAVFNPAYAMAGPARSILAGLATVPSGCAMLVIGNGDTVFSAGMLGEALRAPPGITLFVSDAAEVAADELCVTIDAAGRVREATKAGERMCAPPRRLVSAGLVALRGTAARTQFTAVLKAVAAAEVRDGRLRPWHDAFRLLATTAVPAGMAVVDRSAWAEFDTAQCIARYAATPVPDEPAVSR